MKKPYYVFSSGRLARRHNTLAFERSDAERVPDDEPDAEAPCGDGAAAAGGRVTFPIEAVESLYLFGEVALNSRLVTFLAQHHVPAFFFDYYGHFTAALYPRQEVVSGRVRVEQARHYLGPRRRMRLARAIVGAAAFNILRVVKYYAGRTTGAGAEVLAGGITRIGLERDEIERAPDIPTLMSAEGRIRECYYRLWPVILGPRAADFPFERRERRPPSNELNALISFGNALCYTATLRQIYRTALDPSISYLHEPGDRRFSLALDLAEVFKPLLVDRAIFRLIKTGALTPAHFEPRLGGCYLSERGRRTFVDHWDERLRQTVQHRTLNRPISYERLIRLECHKLVRHLCDPRADPYRGFRMWW